MNDQSFIKSASATEGKWRIIDGVQLQEAHQDGVSQCSQYSNWACLGVTRHVVGKQCTHYQAHSPRSKQHDLHNHGGPLAAAPQGSDESCFHLQCCGRRKALG
jgi:hypothetical protein